jgi:hypothetical protein
MGHERQLGPCGMQGHVLVVVVTHVLSTLAGWHHKVGPHHLLHTAFHHLSLDYGPGHPADFSGDITGRCLWAALGELSL